MTLQEIDIDRIRKKLSKKDAPTQSIIEQLDALGIDPETIISVVEDLTSEGYLDDRRYAEEAFYSDQRKGKSSLHTSMRLASEGVPPSIIEEVSEALNAQEVDAENVVNLAAKFLNQELKKSEGQAEWQPDKAIQRILGKLARRGYDEATAVEAIRQAQQSL